MPLPLVDPPSLRSTSGSMITLSSRNRAVHGEKNRVRCARLRGHARFARHDRDPAWPAWRSRCPLSARTGAREPREGLAVDGHLHRRSSLDRDAGTSCCPCDPCLAVCRAGDPGDAVFSHIEPCAEIPPTSRPRSASRDPRGCLARIRIHPVGRRRVSSRARGRQGGTPA